MSGWAPFRKYEADLELALGDCESVLDVGCGADSPLKHLRRRKLLVGVDAHAESLKTSQARRIHDRTIETELGRIGEHVGPRSFDAVMALDVIEHLSKEESRRLLDQLERIARKRVIVFTPNGFLAQGEYDRNPWQVHLCGWTAAEMRERGYRVIGLRGWKPLRAEYAAIRFRPKFLWLFLSRLTQFWVRSHPDAAFQILCIKDLPQ